MIAGELKDPRIAGLVTVTEVRVTPDLRQARVFVSVFGTPGEQNNTIAGLAAAAGFVRREIGERLQLRRSPEIHFLLDRSEEYGQHIEDLLRQTRKTGKR
jgi:ribosome-binding factor A